MEPLTEQAAERLLAARALTPATPGFVGAAVDLPLAGPGLGPPLIEALAARPPLRHGFRVARSAGMVTVSGPPSPGLEICLERMAQDLSMAQLSGPPPAPDGESGPCPTAGPGSRAGLEAGGTGTRAELEAGGPGIRAGLEAGGTGTRAELEAGGPGIRVGLEAGLEGGGILGLPRRWALAHTLAPVLAAAFANTPLRDGRPTGWRSTRLARHRDLPVLPGPAEPGTAWAAYVLGSAGRPLTESALLRHAGALRPPVAARGHLELDVADRQPGRGWRVVIAVTAALLDDPRAAAAAEEATAGLAGEPRLWERAARDALTDPVLAAAARECFLAAYAALARQGVARDLRDAVADFTQRHVLRGRAPADDVLDRTPAGSVPR